MIAWDMVTKAEFLEGRSDVEYKDRLNYLNWSVCYGSGLKVAETIAVTSVAEAFAINREALLRGEEGTVWKKPAGIWRDSSSGTRDAVKVKVVFEAEYKVSGKYEGEGKAKGMLGGFNIETEDGLIKSNVGSGFSDAQRKEFWEADTTGWIITVEANDVISRSGSATESLFLPIFSERRLDKTVADTRERVLAQLEAAKLGKKLD
jgi:DNA ligase-1